MSRGPVCPLWRFQLKGSERKNSLPDLWENMVRDGGCLRKVVMIEKPGQGLQSASCCVPPLCSGKAGTEAHSPAATQQAERTALIWMGWRAFCLDPEGQWVRESCSSCGRCSGVWPLCRPRLLHLKTKSIFPKHLCFGDLTSTGWVQYVKKDKMGKRGKCLISVHR